MLLKRGQNLSVHAKSGSDISLGGVDVVDRQLLDLGGELDVEDELLEGRTGHEEAGVRVDELERRDERRSVEAERLGVEASARSATRAGRHGVAIDLRDAVVGNEGAVDGALVAADCLGVDPAVRGAAGAPVEGVGRAAPDAGVAVRDQPRRRVDRGLLGRHVAQVVGVLPHLGAEPRLRGVPPIPGAHQREDRSRPVADEAHGRARLGLRERCGLAEHVVAVGPGGDVDEAVAGGRVAVLPGDACKRARGAAAGATAAAAAVHALPAGAVGAGTAAVVAAVVGAVGHALLRRNVAVGVAAAGVPACVGAAGLALLGADVAGGAVGAIATADVAGGAATAAARPARAVLAERGVGIVAATATGDDGGEREGESERELREAVGLVEHGRLSPQVEGFGPPEDCWAWGPELRHHGANPVPTSSKGRARS